MKKKKKFTIAIICDNEITTEVIQLFKFESDIKFKEIKTDGELATKIIVEMEK